MEASPSDSTMKMDAKEQNLETSWDLEQPQPEKKRSGILNTIVAGLALFSDGYNAQISKIEALRVYLMLTHR